MTALSIIFGIILIIGGFACAFTPIATTIGIGYFLIVLFLMYGIFGIIDCIVNKKFGVDGLFAVLSLIFGIIGFCVPNAVAMSTNFMLLYFAAAWLFIHGVMTIVASVDGKKFGASTGMVVLGVILGIIEILFGIYSVAHPVFEMIVIGILIGLFFIEGGINMIVTGTVFAKVKKDIDDALS